MAVTHGEASTYRSKYYKCRCLPCTKANTERTRIERESRRRRIRKDPTLAPHGKLSTYRNWGCHCKPCKEAGSKGNKEERARRKNKPYNETPTMKGTS